MVKSSSPMSRPGVEAGTSTYWSLPLNRTAEPTRPGTCKGRNSGSSKVNQADRPAGTGAQWGWAQIESETRIDIGDGVKRQRKVVVFARHQRDGALTGAVPGARWTRQ